MNEWLILGDSVKGYRTVHWWHTAPIGYVSVVEIVWQP